MNALLNILILLIGACLTVVFWPLAVLLLIVGALSVFVRWGINAQGKAIAHERREVVADRERIIAWKSVPE